MTDKAKAPQRAEKQAESNFTSIAISKEYYAKVQDLKKKFPVRTSNAAVLEALIDAGLPQLTAQ